MPAARSSSRSRTLALVCCMSTTCKDPREQGRRVGTLSADLRCVQSAAREAGTRGSPARGCRAAVRDRTKFVFLRPTVMLGLFQTPTLHPMAEEIERTVRAIVNQAAR